MDVVKPDVSLDVFGKPDSIACSTDRLTRKVRNQDSSPLEACCVDEPDSSRHAIRGWGMSAERFDLVIVGLHLYDGARSHSVRSDNNAFPVSANKHCMVVIVDLTLI